MTAVLKYDAACQAIAEAKSVDEVTDWIDKAAAVGNTAGASTTARWRSTRSRSGSRPSAAGARFWPK
jgi:hypothetical protein